MNNTNNTNCEENGHQYTMWRLSETEAEGCRVCKNCGYLEKLPITTASIDILNQIKTVQIAKDFLKKLCATEESDANIVGYLYAVLDTYVNYLDDSVEYSKDASARDVLIAKMEKIEKSDYTSMENATFINYLSAYLKLNNQEAFQDTMDNFYEFNKQDFMTMTSESTNTRHHL